MNVGTHKKQVRARKGAQPNPPRGDVEVVHMAATITSARAAERQARIARAAYFRAEKRGFEPGHELEDWLAAEAEVADICVPESQLESYESRSLS